MNYYKINEALCSECESAERLVFSTIQAMVETYPPGVTAVLWASTIMRAVENYNVPRHLPIMYRPTVLDLLADLSEAGRMLTEDNRVTNNQ